MSKDWQPTASRALLERRALALARLRAFFAARGVMEVDTPVVINAPVSDVHIHSTEVRFPSASQPFFLRTSPEFAMKRLLAAGSGDIYEIGHVVRGLERGRQHNAEFTLIEWYRLGFSLERLMDEVEELVREVLGPKATTLSSERLTYREAFLNELRLDPMSCSIEELVRTADRLGFDPGSPTASHPERTPSQVQAAPLSRSTGAPSSLSQPTREPSLSAQVAPRVQLANRAAPTRDELLDFLMATRIGPALGRNKLTFVHRYPASQAALARLDPNDTHCALRFELYCEGLELANGFHELASPTEQRARFEQDNAERQRRGLPVHAPDDRLLSALESGLPDCAGVALGFDRLLMLATGATSIDEVLPFPTERA
jgi:elongation factor P--(R)-beta-lysine ligase